MLAALGRSSIRRSKAIRRVAHHIRQKDNLQFPNSAQLPTIIVKNATNPIFRIIDESNGETIYTFRIKGNSMPQLSLIITPPTL